MARQGDVAPRATAGGRSFDLLSADAEPSPFASVSVVELGAGREWRRPPEPGITELLFILRGQGSVTAGALTESFSANDAIAIAGRAERVLSARDELEIVQERVSTGDGDDGAPAVVRIAEGEARIRRRSTEVQFRLLLDGVTRGSSRIAWFVLEANEPKGADSPNRQHHLEHELMFVLGAPPGSRLEAAGRPLALSPRTAISIAPDVPHRQVGPPGRSVLLELRVAPAAGFTTERNGD